MKNQKMESRLQDEILSFIEGCQSLMLASQDEIGDPYASYAPFAPGDECLYILISEIAVHAINLRLNPRASVLIVEDESKAETLFARVRVSYKIDAELIEHGSAQWQQGVDILAARHGDRINNLSELSDFRLFKLVPQGGRYVKGFGRAYQIAGNTLSGESLDHMRDGHKKRDVA